MAITQTTSIGAPPFTSTAFSRGEAPDLPVQQSTKLELVINLKSLAVSRSILLGAIPCTTGLHYIVVGQTAAICRWTFGGAPATLTG